MRTLDKRTIRYFKKNIGQYLSIFILLTATYAMGKIEGYIEIFIPLKIYLIVILIGVVTYFIINKFHIKKINRIPLENVLKDRE